MNQDNFIQPRRKSSDYAKDRMKHLLFEERFCCDYETMDAMKKDVGIAVSKYLEIQSELIEIEFEKSSFDEKEQGTIAIHIPISYQRMKTIK